VKYLLPLSVLSCALLAGCGAPAATESAASPSASTAAEQLTVSDTEAETCEQLYAGGSDAPFPASVSLMGAIFTEGPVEPIPTQQQSEIEYTQALMTGIASTANEDMKDLVERAYRPFNLLMANGYDTGGVSVEDYKEAASELLKRCPPPDDLVFQTREPASRDWVSELVAIGYIPGPDGGKWLDERMQEDAQPFCNASLTGPGDSKWNQLTKQTEFEAEVLGGAKAADPEMELGYALKVLERYCPDRVDAFDTVLKLHPELGPPKGRS
jgi:hypothetical protein